MKVSVEFEWTRTAKIDLGPDGKLKFPNLPLDPGLYRLWLGGAEHSAVYIGETDNLRRRATHYRNPGPSQRTNIRLNERLRTHLAAGGRADMYVVITAKLEIDGNRIPLDLSQKAARRLVENAALVEAAVSGADQVENL
jgi:hypothetical protein